MVCVCAYLPPSRSAHSTYFPLLSSCILLLQDGDGNLTGLTVRVAFNGVWKESLTELSGGQRSLLALSLILALLLFKPAPMYILDEVDAALDLSHTQNIGHMIKTHFKSSQFIVVSLKQGLFSNANVIFRTKVRILGKELARRRQALYPFVFSCTTCSHLSSALITSPQFVEGVGSTVARSVPAAAAGAGSAAAVLEDEAPGAEPRRGVAVGGKKRGRGGAGPTEEE